MPQLIISINGQKTELFLNAINPNELKEKIKQAVLDHPEAKKSTPSSALLNFRYEIKGLPSQQSKQNPQGSTLKKNIVDAISAIKKEAPTSRPKSNKKSTETNLPNNNSDDLRIDVFGFNPTPRNQQSSTNTLNSSSTTPQSPTSDSQLSSILTSRLKQAIRMNPSSNTDTSLEKDSKQSAVQTIFSNMVQRKNSGSSSDSNSNSDSGEKTSFSDRLKQTAQSVKQATESAFETVSSLLPSTPSTLQTSTVIQTPPPASPKISPKIQNDSEDKNIEEDNSDTWREVNTTTPPLQDKQSIPSESITPVNLEPTFDDSFVSQVNNETIETTNIQTPQNEEHSLLNKKENHTTAPVDELFMSLSDLPITTTQETTTSSTYLPLVSPDKQQDTSDELDLKQIPNDDLNNIDTFVQQRSGSDEWLNHIFDEPDATTNHKQQPTQSISPTTPRTTPIEQVIDVTSSTHIDLDSRSTVSTPIASHDNTLKNVLLFDENNLQIDDGENINTPETTIINRSLITQQIQSSPTTSADSRPIIMPNDNQNNPDDFSWFFENTDNVRFDNEETKVSEKVIYNKKATLLDNNTNSSVFLEDSSDSEDEQIYQTPSRSQTAQSKSKTPTREKSNHSHLLQDNNPTTTPTGSFVPPTTSPTKSTVVQQQQQTPKDISTTQTTPISPVASVNPTNEPCHHFLLKAMAQNKVATGVGLVLIVAGLAMAAAVVFGCPFAVALTAMIAAIPFISKPVAGAVLAGIGVAVAALTMGGLGFLYSKTDTSNNPKGSPSIPDEEIRSSSHSIPRT